MNEKRSTTHGSVGSTDDAYVLPILPYGACGNEIRSPYRVGEITMSMAQLQEHMVESYEPSTYFSPRRVVLPARGPFFREDVPQNATAWRRGLGDWEMCQRAE